MNALPLGFSPATQANRPVAWTETTIQTTDLHAAKIARVTPTDLAGLGCVLAYGVLAWLARQAGEPPLGAFFAVVGCSFALTVGLYQFSTWRKEALPLGRLIFWAVVFRLCGLVGGPFYEDDFYRYLWDAFRFVQDGTPYGAAPEAYFADGTVPEAFQRILDQVNNPHLATIYGPTTQLAFLLAYAIEPGSVLALQAVFVTLDLLLIGLLARLAPARAVLLYAWCPLVVKEVAFTAHTDIVGVSLLVAAVVLARDSRWHGAALCLALSVAAKWVAVLAVPFVLLRAGARPWATFAATLALLYAPFVWQGGTDVATLAVFAREWVFNASLFEILASALPELQARAVAALGLLGVWCWCYREHRRHQPAVPRGDWIFGALLALAPVVNPWYLLWVLPFAAIYPSTWAWTASATLLLSYITGLNLADLRLHPFAHPSWVRPLEYGLIALALGWDLRHWQRRRKQPKT